MITIERYLNQVNERLEKSQRTIQRMKDKLKEKDDDILILEREIKRNNDLIERMGEENRNLYEWGRGLTSELLGRQSIENDEEFRTKLLEIADLLQKDTEKRKER